MQSVKENLLPQLTVSYAQSMHEQKIKAFPATFPFFYFKIADGHQYSSVNKGFGLKYFKGTFSYEIKNFQQKI